MTAPKPKLTSVPQFEPTTLATQDAFPRDACLDWMREKCDPKHGRYQVIAFSLSHIDARAVGDAFTDITHVMLPVDDKTGALPQGLTIILESAADEFCRAAAAHCAALFTNRQGFLIKGHHRGGMIEKDDGTKEEEDVLTVSPRTTFPFSVTPPVGVRENYEGNEKATAEGALGAMQRTLDTTLRTMQSSNEKMQKGYENWNEHILNKLTEVLEINIAQSRQIQDAENQKTTRDILVKEADFKIETQAMIVEAIQTHVVPLASLLLQAKLGVVPALPADNPLVAQVRALKLRPAQLGPFVVALDADQRKAISPLVTELSQSMTAEEQNELYQFFLAADAAEKQKSGDPK